MAVNFAALLDVNVETAERPKPLPPGTYTFMIEGAFEPGESKQKKTPYVRFHCKPLAAGNDVDQSQLPENWNSRKISQDFFITDDAMYRLREFLEHCGIGIAGRTFAAALNDTANATFLGVVAQEVVTERNGVPLPQPELYSRLVATAKA